MFVDMLDKNQKATLIEVLCEVAQADGEVSEAERETVTRYALSIGVSARQLDRALASGARADEAALRALPEAAKRVVLIEAQTLAMTGDYDEREQVKVRDLASRLGLEPDDVEAVDAFVRRGFSWIEEGSRVVAGVR